VSDSIGAALGRFAAALTAAGFDEPRRRARRLIAGTLDLPPADLLAHPERPLAAGDVGRLETALRRMLAGEPLSRILGRREFWGLDFALSPDTLDPRPETETVVEAVLQLLPERDRMLRLLDLGTGTGCLLLALLHEFPAAFGVGVDVAEGAALTARRNAAALGLSGRAVFVVGDWGAAVAGRFDAIVANPPYIATDSVAGLPHVVIGYDPRRALDGGADGLVAYRVIAGAARRLLAPGGIVAWEVGEGQARAVADIAANAGLVVEDYQRDLAGIIRCVVAVRK